ncbi:TQO small subunit DoxD [compost metagenome]
MRFEGLVTLYIRLALGLSFLSAIGDRFGMWGAPGETNVTWGNTELYMDYVAVLTPFIPDLLVPIAGWIATILEIALGILLIIGFKTRTVAFISGSMLILFALGMILGVGFKAPFDYSVFSASAGAFLLVFFKNIPFSLDSLLNKKSGQAFPA